MDKIRPVLHLGTRQGGGTAAGDPGPTDKLRTMPCDSTDATATLRRHLLDVIHNNLEVVEQGSLIHTFISFYLN